MSEHRTRIGRAYSATLRGIDGVIIRAECDLVRGLPSMSIIGLGDTAVIQARDRVRSAMNNSGLSWPKNRIILSLSPADVPKSGSSFDLVIVTAIIMAQIDKEDTNHRALELWENTIFIGELGLDGRVHGVSGVLPMLLAAEQQGMTKAVIPRDNYKEATVIKDMDIYVLDELQELVTWLQEGRAPRTVASLSQNHQANEESVRARKSSSPTQMCDFSMDIETDMKDIVGQESARRALEIAAVGGHNLLLMGPPGSGKSMLAHRLPDLLPPLNYQEQRECAAIASIVGNHDFISRIWQGKRPFIAPHPHISITSLIGGGQGKIMPGLITQAHHGVLFLDEILEMKTAVLDSLRIPLETHKVELARYRNYIRYPAYCQLIAAANFCPCGAEKEQDCQCPGDRRRRYRKKLSGPLVSRIDLIAYTKKEKRRLKRGAENSTADSTAVIAQRVAEAQHRAIHRWSQEGQQYSTAHLPGAWIRKHYPPEEEGIEMMYELLHQGELSQRGLDRLLKVSWTLADMAGKKKPGVAEILDAYELYTGDLEEVGQG